MQNNIDARKVGSRLACILDSLLQNAKGVLWRSAQVNRKLLKQLLV